MKTVILGSLGLITVALITGCVNKQPEPFVKWNPKMYNSDKIHQCEVIASAVQDCGYTQGLEKLDDALNSSIELNSCVFESINTHRAVHEKINPNINKKIVVDHIETKKYIDKVVTSVDENGAKIETIVYTTDKVYFLKFNDELEKYIKK